ncbi:phosphate acetyltransferase/phosphate butyryltransferase [Crenobacter luteus]|uniref:Phosphate acetyltransferase n=1 Tax=Crenobacter luteus TaxID=1452487 RepID=A0A165FC62_9NEIS|nr:bifunctional enoyl-CoA hydratase/phosphate acetyltransferase [Crenobacter luteus]KZE32775.1 phosphate acetyltransferase [Crenobacter luteus]TCP12668.1 phosphate acetyltransferase/phosphate butyryltransferase [Crenobacter luteus]
MTRDEHAFTDIIAAARDAGPLPMAVAHPASREALLGAFEAADEGLARPILVGPRDKLARLAAELERELADFELIDTPHSHAAAERAVRLVREGHAELLMKGSLHTDEFMEAVLERSAGLRTDRRVSHVFVMKVESYPRYLFITDAAINIEPDLAAKRDIVQNAIDLTRALGIATPRVAILSAVETVNPKLRSTIDAAALCKMADRGQISGGVLDGPLAFDNAISAEAAASKGIVSPVAGRPDVLVVPDLESGNMLAKQLTYLAAAASAGVVMGARVPIVLTSRADDAAGRLASTAVASLVAHRRRHGGPL